nr:DEAD/DEAH box helicase [Eubacterium sp.]
MLDEKEIQKKAALPTTYHKGKRLMEQDAVTYLVMENMSGDVYSLTGNVEGSYGNDYDTYITVKTIGTVHKVQIQDGMCDCPAYKKYGGFCKHLVATGLALNKWADIYEEDFSVFLNISNPGDEYLFFDDYDEIGLLGDMDEPKEEKLPWMMPDFAPSVATASGRLFSNITIRPETSEELTALMRDLMQKQQDEFCQEVSQGDVKLEVTLHVNPSAQELSLRVGNASYYVVKNIETFVEHVKRREFVTYGKKLAFVHTPEAFAKETIPLLQFLQRYVDGENGSSVFSYGDRRYMKMQPQMWDTLAEIMEGKTIWVEGYESEKMEVPVVRKDPLFPVELKEEMDGTNKCTSIVFPEIMFFPGVAGCYVWWENCIYICSEKYGKNMKELLCLMALNRLESKDYFFGLHAWREQRMLKMYEADYSMFSVTVLPLLERYTDLQVEGVDFSEYEPEDGKYEVYLDVREDSIVICEAKGIYGDNTYWLDELPNIALKQNRDFRAEYEIRTLVQAYFPEKSRASHAYELRGDDDRLAELVEHGLGQLELVADVYLSENMKKIRIAKPMQVTTGLSIQGDLLNVTWDVEGMSQNELHDILAAYRRKKRYYRLKSGELLNLQEGGIRSLAEMQDALHLTKAQLQKGSTGVALYRAMYLDALMQDNADRIQVERDASFCQLLERFDDVKRREYEVPASVTADLRGYQKAGYQWAMALSELGFGGILADDMGLGKTLQMITYLSSTKGTTHLVVTPASLVYNWESEFQKFAPEMKVCLMVGAAEERKELLEAYEHYDVVVTSYDLLRRDIELYQDKSFGCQIIDEAQYIKNHNTQASKAVKSIDSRVRFALTGTPIENRLSELWSIFEYLMPGYLYSYKSFKDTFESSIVEGGEGDSGHALEQLHRMIAPFLLRRLKKDVLKELPDKVEEVKYAKLGKEQEKLYQATEKNIVTSLQKKSGKEYQENKLQILAELTKLRQICCDPSLLYDNYKGDSAKLETCMELLHSAVEGGHKVLLFSQFTSMLEVLKKRLKAEGISYFMLTGSTSKRKRRDLVERFQNGEADVFLISLKAGGTGLNLTAADIVIHYDPWWNVAAQNQATDRTHRIGQENSVTVIRLIARGTIEERILKLQERKQDLANKVISAEGVSVASLSREELLGLFS